MNFSNSLTGNKNFKIRWLTTFFILFVLIVVFFFLKDCILAKSNTKLISGPMLGYSEHREILIWLQTNCPRNIKIIFWPKNDTSNKLKKEVFFPNRKQQNCSRKISKIILENLEPATEYQYQVLIDNQEQKFNYKLEFKTRKIWEYYSEDRPEEFNFLLGSCNFMKDPDYDRKGETYGLGTEIFLTMDDFESDFMIWLGDNFYFRPSDYSSSSGISYRYSVSRSKKNLQEFFATTNHYAIWDDHDYGPNNSGKTYFLRDKTRELFLNYWGNKTYGENNQGIYSKFSYADADFFLLDNRYFRDETELKESLLAYKTQLGNKQLNWLKNSLAGSKATFKFIVSGGQILNHNAWKESFNYYKKEREEIIDFIEQQKIKGVIFLSGDRHHTELIKNYGLYELTCSPLGSAPNLRILETSEKNNKLRVKDTLVLKQNFCRVKISGQKSKRKVEFSVFDRDGRRLWSHSIKEGTF